jgi:hypothetical protein
LPGRFPQWSNCISPRSEVQIPPDTEERAGDRCECLPEGQLPCGDLSYDTYFYSRSKGLKPFHGKDLADRLGGLAKGTDQFVRDIGGGTKALLLERQARLKAFDAFEKNPI